MPFNFLPVWNIRVNLYLIMFLLVSLLFVTAAVLVDKPEPVMELPDIYDERFDREGKGTDTISAGDPELVMSLDKRKFLPSGPKTMFYTGSWEKDEDEDITVFRRDIIYEIGTGMGKSHQYSKLEQFPPKGDILEGASAITQDPVNIFRNFEEFDDAETRLKRDVSSGPITTTEKRHHPETGQDNGHKTNGELENAENVFSEGTMRETVDKGDSNTSGAENSEDIINVQSTKRRPFKKYSKFHKQRFDPWMFEREIGQDPHACFSRLSLTKSEIEDYTLVSNSEPRLNAMTMTVIDTNYTQSKGDNHLVYKRSKDNSTLPEDASYSGMALEQEVVPPMVVSPELVPDCHFLLPYNRQWIKLVSSCPLTWRNATVEHMCVPKYRDIQNDNTIDLLSLPVQDGRGVVYRNIFCAECNRATNVQAWDVVVLCDGTSSLFFIDGNVMMTIMPKLAAAPHCRKTLWPRQPEKVETCLVTKRRAVRHPGNYEDELVTYPVSFAVLMNFGFDGKTHILFSTTHEEVASSPGDQVCSKPNQVYDDKNKLCRTFVCPAGYRLVGEECLTDDITGTLPSSEDLLPNVQTLTHLPDVAVITLIVNATIQNLLAIRSPAFKEIMVQGMATLFNISSERIQNFTIELVDSSEPGPEVAVQTLNKHPVIQPGVPLLGQKSHDGDFPSEEGSPKGSVLPKTRKSQTDGPQSNTSSSETQYHQSAAPKTEPATSTHKHIEEILTNRQMVTEAEASHKDLKKEFILKKNENNILRGPVTVSQHEKRRPTVTTTQKSLLNILNEKTIALKFRFLLLPARSSMLNEGTVSSIKEKMNSLFKQKKFTLSLNGTVVTVVDMVNKDHHDTMGAFCNKGKMRFYFADQLEIINAKDSLGHTVTHVMVNSTNSIYGPGKFDLTLWVAGNVGSDTNVTDIMGYAFVCVMPRISHANCVRFNLKEHEYTLLPNKSILWGERLYNMAEYVYVDETNGLVEICVPDSMRPNKTSSYVVVKGCDEGFKNFMLAEGYITATLGRISIVALAIVFITYCLFPRLRNLPGVNTMNLTFALLVAESILITGERSVDPPWLCSLVAILLHYFFLASFFWMNVMSFDVFRTFANTTYILPHIREKGKYLCKYILYCWGSPAVIVFTCVILDFTKIIPGVEIGYRSQAYEPVDPAIVSNNTEADNTNSTEGKSHEISGAPGCWIQQPIASLTAFGAPIVIIFLINICLFVKTIHCIQRTAKFTMDNTRRSSVNRRTGRHDVMLYIRMSTVMGFTWVFGLASAMISPFFPPSNVVCYTERFLGLLFVIFNCSQGLFIFFAFVTKRRVFYLYKGLWVRIRQKIKLYQTDKRQRYTSGSNTSTFSSTSTTSISTIS